MVIKIQIIMNEILSNIPNEPLTWYIRMNELLLIRRE